MLSASAPCPEGWNQLFWGVAWAQVFLKAPQVISKVQPGIGTAGLGPQGHHSELNSVTGVETSDLRKHGGPAGPSECGHGPESVFSLLLVACRDREGPTVECCVLSGVLLGGWERLH